MMSHATSGRTGAHAIVDSFVRQDVRRLYIYPGGTIAPIFEAAVPLGIELFTTRHEQGAGYAALAAARLTGRPQVVMVTAGPGVTNVLTPMADAYFDSSPLVLLAGQVVTSDMRGDRPVRQRGFQEVDTRALLAPITKAQFHPTKPSDLVGLVDRAFEVARSGRPGPVLVDLPMNVQRGEIGPERTSWPPAEVSLADPAPELIARAAEWIRGAERPVILAGHGVLLGGGTEALRQIVDRAGIPVAMSLLGLGAIPTDSPFALGLIGHTGSQYCNLAVHAADLLVVVGSRLDVRQTGSRTDSFVPSGRVIRIDLDPAEIEHSRVKTHLDIRADAGRALALLGAKLARGPLPDWSRWRERIAAWRTEYPLSYPTGNPLQPQHVIETANRLTRGRPVICVTGVGSHQQWVARHFDFDYPSRPLMTSAGHGAMGFDLPVAMGAQLVRPDTTVLCLVGDGSLQINIQELAAIVEYRLPVKIVVLDNHRLAIVSQLQKIWWGTDPTCGQKWNPDFAAIARAYGIPGWTLDDASQTESALRTLLETDGPGLLHCIVDPDTDVVPMMLTGQTMDRMWPYHK